jgi:hypothetical protein
VHEVRGRSVLGRTIHGSFMDTLLLRVQYWWFESYFRTIRRSPADSPPSPHGQYARCLRMVCLVLRRVASPLLPEFHFHFVIVWGLFVGLVSLL